MVEGIETGPKVVLSLSEKKTTTKKIRYIIYFVAQLYTWFNFKSSFVRRLCMSDNCIILYFYNFLRLRKTLAKRNPEYFHSPGVGKLGEDENGMYLSKLENHRPDFFHLHIFHINFYMKVPSLQCSEIALVCFANKRLALPN